MKLSAVFVDSPSGLSISINNMSFKLAQRHIKKPLFRQVRTVRPNEWISISGFEIISKPLFLYAAVSGRYRCVTVCVPST